MGYGSHRGTDLLGGGDGKYANKDKMLCRTTDMFKYLNVKKKKNLTNDNPESRM